jgi:Flp pilus assembly protein CpaB
MKQKNLILMVVAVGCGLVAAFLTTQINAKPKVETLEVWVASKDLPVGTVFTKADLPKYAVKKKLPKDGLPPAFITNEEDFYDKRLTRSVLKDETFHPGSLGRGGITLPDGYDMVSLPIGATNAVAGFVTPGSKVDVLATLRLGKNLEAFPVLIDMLVIAVNGYTDITEMKKQNIADVNSVSFAATQKQALVLSLAKARGCHLELLLRHVGKPIDPKYSIDEVIAKLKDDSPGKGVSPTEGKPGGMDTDIQPTNQNVKVWVAVENIPAGTEITRELVNTKLKEKEAPRELAEDAYSDLTKLIENKNTFPNGLAKGNFVTFSSIGGPKPPVTNVVTKAGGKPTRDIIVNTGSGSVVHRFYEHSPGDWKFLSILTPEEAAKNPPTVQSTPMPKP